MDSTACLPDIHQTELNRTRADFLENGAVAGKLATSGVSRRVVQMLTGAWVGEGVNTAGIRKS